MRSHYHHRFRQRSRTALGLAGALLFTVYGPVKLAAAQTEGGEQQQKLEYQRGENSSSRGADRERHEMDELQAEVVDRGLLVTLDDAPFATNGDTLTRSGVNRLKALAGFLEHHPEHTVAIDGYAGASDYRYDQALVKRRADAVKAFLIRQGIAPSRLTARGDGQTPHDGGAIARQPQRRVEVLIKDRLTSAPPQDVTAPGT